MKVAMIIPSLKIGGGQKVAIEIAKKKNNVIFIVIEKRVDNFYTDEVEAEHKVYYLDKEIGFNPIIFLKIARIYFAEKPDIVHFHLGVSLYGLLPAFVFPKMKLIYTFHTIAQKDSEGMIRKLCNIGIKCRGMIPIAITETVRESIEKIYGIKNVKIIHNGIEIHPKRDSFHTNTGKVKLIAVGQIWKIKNHSFMIDVMRKLQKRCPGTYELTILGDGPLKKEIEEKINSYHLGECVKMMGNVEGVDKYYLDSDIFILTSEYEGLSLATLEAMSYGLPIISTDVGGMRDIVGDNGFLVKTGDIDGFADKIEYLSGNQELRNVMGEASYNIAQLYDVKQMCAKYEQLYEELVQK